MAAEHLATLTGLAQNVALLLSLTLLYSAIRPHWLHARAMTQTLLAGTLFGLIAVAGMHTPMLLVPGVISDARAIPVVLAGPFGGAGAALTAAVIASAYRAWLGGVGSLAGVGSILTVGVLGAAVALRWRGREREMGALAFLGLGLALDAIMLLWVAVLPDRVAGQVLSAAAVPVGLFLPFGTLVLGTLLVNATRRHDERERLTLTQFSLERTAEALFWIDAEGQIVNVNPAAERLTGYPRATLLTRRVWDLDLDTTRASWASVWETTRVAGSLVGRQRFRRSDGTEVPVETSSDFVEYQGRTWISVFARDITERSRAEAERAAQLAREQALRNRAEEANVLKDQFLATLSHELRTPLTSILGYARLLRAGGLKSTTSERALEMIDRNAQAQARIVDDLLDMSSIVLGKLAVERRPMPLTPLVEAEVEAARPEAETRQLRLDFRADAPLRQVSGDPMRLEQVVRNLLSNALKFTPPGGSVSVRVEDGERHVRIVVRDTGMGIAPEFVPYVFDRFRQGDSSMTRAHGGLGVGLAIVKHLVALHDGRVWVESGGDGRGTTFTVELPCLDTPVPAAALGRPGAESAGTPDLDGVRVLVVDDEHASRELVNTVLTACGAHVTPAASAEQAMTELRRRRPDVVLTDIAMPGEDGYALLRRIQALRPEHGGAIPTVALTAHAGREHATRALAAGFAAHVAKPFEPRELARVVAALARRHAAPRSAD